MKIYNEQDFIEIIRKDLNPLTFEDFLQTKQIGILWDKFKSDDIRVISLKSKDNFYNFQPGRSWLPCCCFLRSARQSCSKKQQCQ